jgi:small GTP-binding protein
MEGNWVPIEIVLLGNAKVGKTSIFKRIMAKTPSDDQSLRVGTSYCSVPYISNCKSYILNIWDTSSEFCLHQAKRFFKVPNFILLIYDISSKKSFRKLETMINGIKENYQLRKTTCILVGNKIDRCLQREVSFSDAQLMAKSNGMINVEICARDNINIIDTLNLCVHYIM